MLHEKYIRERGLGGVAKRFRKMTGKTRAEAGRDMSVSHVSIHRAEENPEISLLKLRIRMIEAYSPYRVSGPVYLLKKK